MPKKKDSKDTVVSTSCEYIGMKRDFVPTCEEKGEEKLITDDVTPGVCQINQKWEDGEWGEWGNPEIITEQNIIERLGLISFYFKI